MQKEALRTFRTNGPHPRVKIEQDHRLTYPSMKGQRPVLVPPVDAISWSLRITLRTIGEASISRIMEGSALERLRLEGPRTTFFVLLICRDLN